jgi:pSer/pThr/pTyr-binding forkhead associated (FHA) protein
MSTSGLLNRKKILLMIDNRSVALPLSREIVIGRLAPTEKVQPDIDLRPFDADQKGVSRRHIKIIYKEAQFWVIDLASLNGTWLNDRPLKPVANYPLHDGDRLRLGRLEIGVKLVPPTPEARDQADLNSPGVNGPSEPFRDRPAMVG